MTVVRLLVVFIFTGLLIGCDPNVKTIKDDIESLQTDIKLLRTFLSSIPTPTQCPDPGEHTARFCRYTLTILEPLPKHEHWYKATIPHGVVKDAQANCEKVKAKYEDLANYPCLDPQKYKHWEYAIYVEDKEGKKVEAKKTYSFVNDPVTNHLIVIEEVS